MANARFRFIHSQSREGLTHFMKLSVLRTRFSKVATSLANPSCWRALSLGVAPVIEHLPLLKTLDVDGVLDVGANRGQFSLACIIALPSVPILAFEPIPHEAELFCRIHQRSSVVLKRCALGDKNSTSTLHVSKRADSSSLLPIGERQIAVYPETSEAGTIEVDVRVLDSFLPQVLGRNRQLLKIDVQGFELNVLRGGVEMLKLCQYVYAECSEVTLYEGQSLRPDVTAFLDEHGFSEKGSWNHCYSEGQLIQADYLYEKRLVRQ